MCVSVILSPQVRIMCGKFGFTALSVFFTQPFHVCRLCYKWSYQLLMRLSCLCRFVRSGFATPKHLALLSWHPFRDFEAKGAGGGWMLV